MKTPSAGFSTIELVVALAIAAIAMAVAAPSMPFMAKKARITAAHDSFVTSLRFTRMEALRQNTSMKMVAKDAKDWSLGWDVSPAVGGDVLRTVRPFGGSVTILSSKALGTFQYSAAGYLETPADVVNICDSNQSGETGRAINISAVGRVAVDSNYKCTP